jgi:thymidylate synthase (FAD)
MKRFSLNDNKAVEKAALFFEIKNKELKKEIKDAEYKTIMIKVLDHGCVELLDIMGNDDAICDAARVSTGKQKKEKNYELNENLIRYLWRNKHTSPFEMVEFKFYIKLPIFVMRQHIRHRTASVNEMSGRYRILPNEVYIPKESRIEGKGKINKQGGEGVLSDEVKQKFIISLEETSKKAFEQYKLYDEAGISNEIARLGLPVNTYTECYWKMDLRNLLHYLELRLHPHAQWEIRQYAKAMAEIVKEHVPVAYKAFEDYTLNAVTFSAQEMIILKDMIEFLKLHAEDKVLSQNGKEDALEVLWRVNNKQVPGKSELEDFKKKIGLL